MSDLDKDAFKDKAKSINEENINKDVTNNGIVNLSLQKNSKDFLV